MNRQQFTGWLTRLLNVLPWRRARRPARSQVQARIMSRPNADRFASPDPHATLRQKAESSPSCSTLHEDPIPPPYETEFPLSRPAPPMPTASLTSSADAPAQESAGPTPAVDPERRLAFGRFLVRRGVFNEGFPDNAVPRQYQNRAPE